MIPQQTFESFPVFSDTGTKIKPDDAKYSAGFQQADVLPAEWMNWEWNKASKGVTDLNRGLDSVEKEIIAVLTEYGISPAEATEDQLKQALIKMRPQIVTCSTAASTAAKTISITGGVLKAGNIYAITMSNENTAADPTLSLNGGTAYPMYDTKGGKLKNGSWQAGTELIVIFTGTKYITLQIDDVIENGNMNAVTSNAVSCIIASSTTVTGARLGTGAVVKIMFTADVTGSDTSTGLSLSYNGATKAVKVSKGGSLVDFVAKEISSGNYKYIQAYATIDMVYNGTNFVIIGNPVVLSGDGYHVHADGFVDKETEFYCSIASGGANDPEVQTGTTYAYTIGPDYGIEVGDVIKVTFAQALQSSSAITKVSLTCGGQTGDIVTTQPDTSVSDAPAAGYKWVASHEFTGGNYSATYKHKVWDANTTLELTWTGTYWLVDSDTIVCQYTSSTQSYLVKTNGYIEQFGYFKIPINPAQINLFVCYKNTDYYANFKKCINTNSDDYSLSCIPEKNTNYFKVRENGMPINSYVAWDTKNF